MSNAAVFLGGLCVGVIVGGVGMYAIIAFINPPLPPSLSNRWGTFPANPKTEWDPNGRDQKLLEDFVYIDSQKKAWVAPKDSVVNGASIPQPFWSILGGPLEGKYRNASIVHDTECEKMKSPWEEVHYMFYEACRCGGLSEVKAKTVYLAVYRFGPRWAFQTVDEVVMSAAPNGAPMQQTVQRTVTVPIPATAMPADATPEKLEELIRATNPSIEELRQLDLSRL